MSTLSLTNVGNSFLTGIDTLNQRLANLSNTQLPDLSDSLAQLPTLAAGPAQELKEKATAERLAQYQNDIENMRTIIQDSMAGLRGASDNLARVTNVVQQLEIQQEWVNAGIMKKTYLVASSGLQTAKSAVLSPVRYLNNHSSELATCGAISLAAIAGYAIGHATAATY